MGIYLTPQGQPPSHPAYLAVGYSVVCDVLERLLESRRSSMDLGLAVLLEHYNQVLRRRVVGESEIVELCRQIYRKHKTALDLIYEHRPDRQNEIVSLLERLVTEQEGLQLDDVSKTKIKFAVTDWDTRAMVSGGGWASSRRVMLFEFWNYPGSLDLKLLVGPSPDNVRRRLLEMAGAGAPLKAPRKSTAVYSTIYSRKWARGNRLEEGDIEDVESKLRRSWEDFLKSDLPRIHSLLRAEGWFWQE
jgi:hypothetical protein